MADLDYDFGSFVFSRAHAGRGRGSGGRDVFEESFITPPPHTSPPTLLDGNDELDCKLKSSRDEVPAPRGLKGGTQLSQWRGVHSTPSW
jgi:hypothetical protein